MLTRRLFLTKSSGIAAGASLAVAPIAVDALAATPEPVADAELLRLWREWLAHFPTYVTAARDYYGAEKVVRVELDKIPNPWRFLSVERKRKGRPARVREFRNPSHVIPSAEYDYYRSEVRVTEYPAARDGRQAKAMSLAREARELEEHEEAVGACWERCCWPASRVYHGQEGEGGAYQRERKLRQAVLAAPAESLVGVAIKAAVYRRFNWEPDGNELADEQAVRVMGFDLVGYARGLGEPRTQSIAA